MPGPADGILDLDVDLGAVENALAHVNPVAEAGGLERPL